MSSRGLLRIYTVTESVGGYYGLCSKKIIKRRLRIAFTEYGNFLITKDRVSVIHVGCLSKIINTSDLKLEMILPISDFTIENLLHVNGKLRN